MTNQAPNPGDPNYSWDDPHGFHHDAEGHEIHTEHHVSPWQLLVAILLTLMFFTWLTVFTADIESFLALNFGIHVSQLTNVMIAMSIATVKAYLVCAYFMHLKHDTPLNNWVLLFTLLTFGVFLLFPAIEVANRPFVNSFRANEQVAGGFGTGMKHMDGTDWSPLKLSKVDWLRLQELNRLIDQEGEEEGQWNYWSHFYDEEYHYHHEAHRFDRQDMQTRKADYPVIAEPEPELWDANNYFARWEKEHKAGLRGHGSHGHGDHGDSHSDDHGDHADDHHDDHHADDHHADDHHADDHHADDHSDDHAADDHADDHTDDHAGEPHVDDDH